MISNQGDTIMRAIVRLIAVLVASVTAILTLAEAATVIEQDGRVYIVDRAGELWDVTEAQERGFKPQGFEYGLGKSVIVPLGEDDLGDEHFSAASKKWVLGIALEEEAHAYSINRLSYHEVANTKIGDSAIAASY